MSPKNFPLSSLLGGKQACSCPCWYQQRGMWAKCSLQQPLRGESEGLAWASASRFTEQHVGQSCREHGRASLQSVLQWCPGPIGQARPVQSRGNDSERNVCMPTPRDQGAWTGRSLRSLPALTQVYSPSTHARTHVWFLPEVTVQQLIRSGGSVPGPRPTMSLHHCRIHFAALEKSSRREQLFSVFN